MKRLICLLVLLLCGTAQAQSTKHLYVTLGSVAGDTTSCKDAKIVVSLDIVDSTFAPFDTSTSFTINTPFEKVYSVDSTGCTVRMNLIPNDYIRPFGSSYRFTCKHGDKELWSIIVALSGTTAAELMALDRAE